MSDQGWPAPTSRDEMLARVVTRGRRIRMINRVFVGLMVGGVAAAGVVGVSLGYSGTVSMVGGAETSVSSDAGALTYFGCPNVGAMGQLHGGDRVYLTGRDDSGEWVQVRSPENETQRVWIQGEHVDPDEVVELPVAGCSEAVGEMALVDGTTTTTTIAPETVEPETTEPEDTTTTTEPAPTTTTRPGQTTTTPPPTTTTKPPTTTTTTTPPTTTTTTTPPTTTTTTQPVAPTFGSVQRSRPTIKEDFSDNCGGITHTTSTISTSVSHPSGSVTVQFRSRVGDGTWSSWQTVSTQTGPVQGQIGPYPPDTVPYNSSAEVSWQFRAIPTDGPVATRTSTGNETVTLVWCSLA